MKKEIKMITNFKTFKGIQKKKKKNPQYYIHTFYICIHRKRFIKIITMNECVTNVFSIHIHIY